MKCFTTPNSKNLIATLRIVTIEKLELTFLVILLIPYSCTPVFKRNSWVSTSTSSRINSLVCAIITVCSSVGFITLLATVFETGHTIAIVIKMVASLNNCILTSEYLILSFNIQFTILTTFLWIRYVSNVIFKIERCYYLLLS